MNQLHTTAALLQCAYQTLNPTVTLHISYLHEALVQVRGALLGYPPLTPEGATPIGPLSLIHATPSVCR